MFRLFPQGFHDIVSVLLLITEDDYEAYLMTEKLCRYYIGDCMRTDFKDMVSIMNLLWLLIEHEDKELYSFLQESGVEPYFITSWIITWFSHDVKDLQVVARVFDALICSHPSYCLYLCASVRIIKGKPACYPVGLTVLLLLSRPFCIIVRKF